MPYVSNSLIPVRAWNRSLIAFGSTEPPVSAIRTVLTSHEPIGTSASAAMEVGTPLTIVARKRVTICQ
jgi:hypothetical protein